MLVIAYTVILHEPAPVDPVKKDDGLYYVDDQHTVVIIHIIQ